MKDREQDISLTETEREKDDKMVMKVLGGMEWEHEFGEYVRWEMINSWQAWGYRLESSRRAKKLLEEELMWFKYKGEKSEIVVWQEWQARGKSMATWIGEVCQSEELSFGVWEKDKKVPNNDVVMVDLCGIDKFNLEAEKPEEFANKFKEANEGKNRVLIMMTNARVSSKRIEDPSVRVLKIGIGYAETSRGVNQLSDVTQGRLKLTDYARWRLCDDPVAERCYKVAERMGAEGGVRRIIEQAVENIWKSYGIEDEKMKEYLFDLSERTIVFYLKKEEMEYYNQMQKLGVMDYSTSLQMQLQPGIKAILNAYMRLNRPEEVREIHRRELSIAREKSIGRTDGWYAGIYHIKALRNLGERVIDEKEHTENFLNNFWDNGYTGYVDIMKVLLEGRLFGIVKAEETEDLKEVLAKEQFEIDLPILIKLNRGSPSEKLVLAGLRAVWGEEYEDKMKVGEWDAMMKFVRTPPLNDEQLIDVVEIVKRRVRNSQKRKRTAISQSQMEIAIETLIRTHRRINVYDKTPKSSELVQGWKWTDWWKTQ